MTTPTIAVVDYGSGNLHSVARALEAAGALPLVTSSTSTVLAADAVVIPGVGHFGACMRALTERDLDRCIRDVHASGRPMFGVCVGMQLLFEGSDEAAEPGLGLLPGTVGRLPLDVKVPHMGWNTVSWASHPFVDGFDPPARFYFVHSYAPDPSVVGTIGVTEHGRPFAAAVAHGSLFTTQFHPEKSGAPGLALYRRFVEAVARP